MSSAAKSLDEVRRSRLNVLAPTRYPWRFNSPRASRHAIVNRNFLPLNYISPKIEGVTAFLPSLGPRFDLIHAFNRIPIGTTPFVIGFESHLPRAFGLEHSVYFRKLTEVLAGPRCRRIVAISKFAENTFLDQHRDSPHLAALRAKLTMHYPTMVMPEVAPLDPPAPGEPLKLLFVGNHFARKGGCVALVAARMARERGLAVEMHVVSRLEVGPSSWVDPTDPAFFEEYRPLLSLPNVVFHGVLPNDKVLELTRAAHFSLLPTFSDTFGYTAIESMAYGTPVIATAQGALREFIETGVNGKSLSIPLTPQGEWLHIKTADRGTPEFLALHRLAVADLADQVIAYLEGVAADPSAYPALRAGARGTAERLFSAETGDRFWDALYDEVVPDA
ncbi:glycosyltransferase family 4 protein [Chthonobacter rhizosphaerae]|uniref:glycosyltransferase family 4 protein n=1 Tax=Chthonobacter rhizosphaerae TaxID=2735553 RepID=UPI0015EE451F|nr:glycosyltransferase family 4 protein [Chthonobacter rhizosphaerae]